MSNPIVQSPATPGVVIRLAIPVLAEQLLAMGVGLSDRMLTGHFLGTSHMAAVSTMAYVLWLVYGTFSLISIGATALVARYVGAGEYPNARRVTTQAFLLGLSIAALVTTAGLIWSDEVVRFLQLEGASAQLAREYILYILPVVPLIMVDAVGVACLRAAGDMMVGLMIMVVVNLVNISLCWALCLGFGPIPRLGWTGIAIGTACGYAVGGVIALVLLTRGRSGIRIEWRRFWPQWDLIRRLLKIGLPGGVDTLSVIGCQLWFLTVINRLGALATAAHGVALSIESLAFLPGVALQMAATTLCGQFLGAGNPRQAARSVWMALLLGAGLMSLGGALIYAGAPNLAPLFVRAEQADVALTAVPLVRTVAFAMPALGAVMILGGALRGAGDTRGPLLISIVGLAGVRVPAAYGLALATLYVPGLGCIPGAGLGVLGAWYAMAMDLNLRALLLLVRFARGRWKHIRV